MPSSAAAAFAAARETPRIAFAPRRALFGVPSSSPILRSSPAWSSASTPATAEAISPLTFATAVLTPLPAHAAPPSRSSTASNSPVEAPDGTAARPDAPDASATSTSTVGLPRLSSTCPACTCLISLTDRTCLLLDLVPEPVGRRPWGGLGAPPQPARPGDNGEHQLADRLEVVGVRPLGD